MNIERGRRYPNLERAFVYNVCHRAGMVTNQKSAAMEKLVDHVSDRLGKGAEEYGNAQFWHVPMIGEGNAKGNSLVNELFEETADLFGWGALLSIRLQHLGWHDLSTKLEVGTAAAVTYGNVLKMVEDQIERRLPTLAP